uniref:Salivary protein 15b n=2 Tax=Phlebotomus duboscqi TaxID=37738 RepID=SP15B_PHLDU|nr:14.5 kDa salivary protein [Phlebotomus duboscqi]ABI20177.1 14.5 kDa salivary protein [Phlebotomus duboscqi]
MKYLGLALISAVFLIGTCQAETPSQKCEEKYKENAERKACIHHCKYQYYGFIDVNYNIAQPEIRKFSNVLMDYGVVDRSKKRELKKVMHDCAKKIKKEARTGDHWLNCRTSIDYYRCVLTSKLIGPQRFDKAIQDYDKTISV